MEPNILPMCVLCQENLKENNKATFSCQHHLCFQCFPFVIYKRLKTKGFQSSFFDQDNMEFECLICQKTSIVSMKIENMLDFYRKVLQDPSQDHTKFEEPKCEACEENIATLCCIDCNNQIYCEGCLNKAHLENKRFANHKIVNLEEKKKVMGKTELQSNMNCKCPSKRTFEFYCQMCKTSICKYCLKSDHDTHKNIPISDILNKSTQINKKDVQSFLKTFSMDFQEFKKKINDSYERELFNSIEKIECNNSEHNQTIICSSKSA